MYRGSCPRSSMIIDEPPGSLIDRTPLRRSGVAALSPLKSGKMPIAQASRIAQRGSRPNGLKDPCLTPRAWL
eukprot:9475917-Pyramimonas_sp.AAC.1